MGTRSTVRVLNNNEPFNEVLVCIYRQYDGAPSGMGEDLKSHLNDGDVTIINGIRGEQETPAHFNGMGCLGAYLVGALKGGGIGNVYVVSANEKQEYNYTLYSRNNKLYMKIHVSVYDKVIFDDLLSNFDSNSLGDWTDG